MGNDAIFTIHRRDSESISLEAIQGKPTGLCRFGSITHYFGRSHNVFKCLSQVTTIIQDHMSSDWFQNPLGSVHAKRNSWEPLKKKLFAESIVAHTGQHGLDTPMTGPAPYIKHKKNRIRGVEMIQLTDNSSTICLSSECSSPASLHSIIKQARLASQWIMLLIFWLPNHLKNKPCPSVTQVW